MAYKYVVFSDGENDVISLETMQNIRKSEFFSNNETNSSFNAGAEADARINFVMENLIARFGEYSIYHQRKSLPHRSKNAGDWQEITQHVYTFKEHTVVLKKGKIFMARGEENKTEIWVDGRYDGFVQIYKSKAM